MKSREEYKFEDVADFLHQNLTLIIRGSKCSEDRAHYIYDCWKCQEMCSRETPKI